MANWLALLLVLVLVFQSVNAQEAPPPPGRPGFVEVFLPQILACLADPDSCTSLSYKYRNLIGTIPTEIGLLTKLTEFLLNGNAMHGTLPTELGLLTDLKRLLLQQNQLVGTIPTELGQATSLTWCSLTDNRLTGPVPTEIARLPLTMFFLENNMLSGNLSFVSMFQRATLETFALGRNLLVGTIPADITRQTRLIHLGLEQNPYMHGTIPSELGLLTNLKSLWLNKMQLVGTIPTELGQATSLTWCSLTDNRLTGPVPTEIARLPLTMFFLENNMLSGNLSFVSMFQRATLETFALGRNLLVGTIPADIAQQTRLIGLGFDQNPYMHGTIPSELGLLTNLKSLWLNKMQLVGTIPTELG
eukprot:CAMPEP_0118957268 /NCGR_PEP_ID=MMETSP1169-20130426/62011_1 /TAXON_ID=36882 /ORGANISM="Pyramimonas obovata, Strain CCMP722" /LENGTH=359 /DNA_ID=CAMNT_0006905329 /DNA_START=287 /DNA_END=1362 /DNA_ORIENTATION=-